LAGAPVPDAGAGSVAGPQVDIFARDVARRENPPRSSRIASTTIQSPVGLHESSGGNTPLAHYAARTDGGNATAPTRTDRTAWARTVDAARRCAGMPTAVEALRSRMHALRGEVLDGHPPDTADEPPQLGLPLRAEDRGSAVRSFWAQPGVLDATGLEARHVAWMTDLDRLAPSPHVGLGLSMALLPALQRAVTERRGQEQQGLAEALRTPLPDQRALQAFHGERPVERLLRAVDNPDADAQATYALQGLERAARSNQFGELARAMLPQLPQDQVQPLRRFLQASTAARSQAADPSQHTSSSPSLAERVRHDARQQLLSPESNLGDRARLDAFFWDNGFRREGPGTPLAEARAHFGKVVSALAGESRDGNLLSAAYAFGLSGADRHLLPDEAGKLEALRDSPALDNLVDRLRRHLQRDLLTSLQDAPQPTAPNRSPLALARLAALEAWSPDRKAELTPDAMIRGPAHARDDPASRAEVERVWQRLEAGGDIESGHRAVPGEADLLRRAQGELSLQRLGLADLQTMAGLLHVGLEPAEQKLFDDAAGIIHAHSLVPGTREPAAVGDMLGQFLDNVQFGNHARFSHQSSVGASARSAGVSLTALEEGNTLADWGWRQAGLAVAPVLHGEYQSSREQVLRVGAATHGVEIFLGHQDGTAVASGAGAGAGFPNDRSLILRGAIGAEGLYKDRRNTAAQGLMLRFDRQVIEDRVDEASQQHFRQNDADIRGAAATLVRHLMQRAPVCRNDAERSALLDDLILRHHQHGLSMTMMSQTARTDRREGSVSAGLSAGFGPPAAGGRVGASVALTMQHAWNTESSQRDETGSYRVTVERRGSYTRARLAGGASASPYVGAIGLPPVPLLRGAHQFQESGGAVRVRIPKRDGNIVPEKSFSDTDTASPRLLRDVVTSRQDEWIALFAHPHRGDADGGRARGQAALDEFFATIEQVHAGNQRYYTRERLHPEVAQRLDELASLGGLAPASMSVLRGEVASQQRRLLQADTSWMPASLIAYERNSVESGAANSFVVPARHTMAAEGEREFMFHTPGWAALRERERLAPRPASLDEADQRWRPLDPTTSNPTAPGTGRP
jgi:hypothetical protein